MAAASTVPLMIGKPELLEHEFKEGTPLTEVFFIRRQFDWNVAVDVEENKGGGCGWSRISGQGERIGGSGGDGTSRARHGRKQRKRGGGSRRKLIPCKRCKSGKLERMLQFHSSPCAVTYRGAEALEADPEIVVIPHAYMLGVVYKRIGITVRSRWLRN
jgi:hypothetical protein